MRYLVFIMTTHPDFRFPLDTSAIYKIRVLGKIAPEWSARLEGLTIRVAKSADADPVTILEGELIDQAALAGVLNSLYNMHLPVLSVKRLKKKPK